MADRVAGRIANFQTLRVLRRVDAKLQTENKGGPARNRPVLHWTRDKFSPSSITGSYLVFSPKGTSTA